MGHGRVLWKRLLAAVAGALVLAQPAAYAEQPAAYAEQPAAGGVPAVQPLAPLDDQAAWSFVHITDTHVGSRAGNHGFPSVVSEVVYLRPDLILHGGDVTELGGPVQYRAYREMARPWAGIPQYFTAGNHESRWLDPGKGFFRALLGEPTYSFDYRGVHFVLLDVSVPGETHGHFDPAVLAWLKEDLERAGRDTPVIIVTHHPVAYDRQRFIDNDEDFLALIAPYNVRAVFSGHGHANLHWVRNGIDFFMTAAGMDGGYKRVVVRDGRLIVQNRVDGGLQTVAEIPLRSAGGARINGEAGDGGLIGRWDYSSLGGPVFELEPVRRLPDGAVQVTVKTGRLPETEKFEVRWNLNAWQPLGEAGAGNWVATVPADFVVDGWHVVRVRLTAKDGRSWSGARRVRIRRPDAPARLVWELQTGGALLAAPAADYGTAYIGSTDGYIYAVGVNDGLLRWKAAAGAPVVAGPAVADGRVIGATVAGGVYAWDVRGGGLLWRQAVAASVVARPVVWQASGRGGLVLVGDASGRITAFDLETGAVRWVYDLGATIRAAPAVGGGRVYVGSWGLDFVALDAAGGKEVWRTRLARQIYYAPASGSPLYAFGRVFVTTHGDAARDNATLHALDAGTGEVLWRAAAGSGFATPVLHGDTVVVSSAGGDVAGFNPLTGERLWTAKSGYATFEASPVPDAAGMVMGSLVGAAVGFAPADAGRGMVPQRMAWQVRLGDNFLFASAAALGDRVLLGSLDGRLYAIDADRAEVPAGPPPFPDLQGHWAAPEIGRMAALSLVAGYPGEGFRPEREVTRGEFAVLLARAFGYRPASGGYAGDMAGVAGHWAAGTVQALEAREVIRGAPLPGGGSAFHPDRPLTRGEAAALLARAARFEPEPGMPASKLADIEGHWAFEAIRLMEARGLVRGVADSGGRLLFAPDRPLTRAEAAVLFWRMLNS